MTAKQRTVRRWGAISLVALAVAVTALVVAAMHAYGPWPGDGRSEGEEGGGYEKGSAQNPYAFMFEKLDEKCLEGLAVEAGPLVETRPKVFYAEVSVSSDGESWGPESGCASDIPVTVSGTGGSYSVWPDLSQWPSHKRGRIDSFTVDTSNSQVLMAIDSTPVVVSVDVGVEKDGYFLEPGTLDLRKEKDGTISVVADFSNLSAIDEEPAIRTDVQAYSLTEKE